MSTITLTEVKRRANVTVTTHDVELQEYIDAAEAYYTRQLGPISGSVTEKHHGGGSSIILRSPHVASLTSAVYSDGTAITVGDLDLDTSTGIVHWDYNTAGAFTSGTRNVTITYTVAALPADHREVIIADVVGYFSATQRGSGSGPTYAPDGYEGAYLSNPVQTFPRIDALARQYPTVA